VISLLTSSSTWMCWMIMLNCFSIVSTKNLAFDSLSKKVFPVELVKGCMACGLLSNWRCNLYSLVQPIELASIFSKKLVHFSSWKDCRKSLTLTVCRFREVLVSGFLVICHRERSLYFSFISSRMIGGRLIFLSSKARSCVFFSRASFIFVESVWIAESMFSFELPVDYMMRNFSISFSNSCQFVVRGGLKGGVRADISSKSIKFGVWSDVMVSVKFYRW
jgi:hypothetical protein